MVVVRTLELGWLVGMNSVISGLSQRHLVNGARHQLSESFSACSAFASVEGSVSELHSYPGVIIRGWKFGLPLPPPQFVSHSSA